MYFPDLSPYHYVRREVAPPDPLVLNVGWLDRQYPHSTGDVPAEVLDRLFDACLHPVNTTRGWHPCPFCARPEPPDYAGYPVHVVRGERELALGSAEIRVPGAGGVTYAAPNLVYHYVERHRYLPPAEFIAALLHTS